MKALAVLLLFPLLLGCDVPGTVAVVRHTIAPPTPRPLAIDIVIDAGVGAATPEGVAATIASSIDAAVGRPGSTIRLFAVGQHRVSESRLLSRYEIPPPARPSRRMVLAHERKHRTLAASRLQAAARTLFEDRSRTQTRLAEAITIAALARNVSGDRVLVIESDLRETSIADLECSVPAVGDFTERLNRAGLLPPDSLRGARIWLAHQRPNDVEGDRCAASVRHYADLTALWSMTLRRTGATVVVTSGIPEVTR